MKFKVIIALLLIVLLTDSKSQDLGSASCDSLLLASSWRNDQVKIYDGCDGSFIRNLGGGSLLDGPQSIFEDHNGDVVVISERNNRLIKFDRQTLSKATVVSGDDPTTTVVEPPLIQSPLGAVIDDENNLIMNGYSQNEIVKVNMKDWQRIQTILPPFTPFHRGSDIGITIGPDNHLYVPGFDSNNVIKINLDDLSVSEVVPAGSSTLNAPRSIVIHNNQIYVTGWRNNAILRYNINGQLIDTFAGILRPTGMIKDGNNHLLVASDSTNSISRINLTDGSIQTVVNNGSGDLNGATFIYRLQKKQIKLETRQHWMIGVGEITGNSIQVNLSSTRNGAFGDNFNTNYITNINWGELSIEFTNCNQANMSYQSFQQIDGLEFGNGGYEIIRIANNSAVEQCTDIGFENITNKAWMSGTFYGGEELSGEGFLLDSLNDKKAIVTWYTYLPSISTK